MFNDRLRATRISRGYTAQVLADHLGVGLRNYQKYETGTTRPTYEGLVALSDFLDVPIDFLLERDKYLNSLGVIVDVSLQCPPRRPKSRKNP